MANAFDLTVNALREQGLNSDQILEELSKLFEKLADSKNMYPEMDADEAKIRTLFNDMCMPVHLSGYDYWVEAILYYKKSKKKSMGKDIYPKVAEIYRLKPSQVESAMRMAVHNTFMSCHTETAERLFGKILSPNRFKPTNTQFIAIMAEQI